MIKSLSSINHNMQLLNLSIISATCIKGYQVFLLFIILFYYQKILFDLSAIENVMIIYFAICCDATTQLSKKSCKKLNIYLACHFLAKSVLSARSQKINAIVHSACHELMLSSLAQNRCCTALLLIFQVPFFTGLLHLVN